MEPSKKAENTIKILSVVIVLAVSLLIGNRTKIDIGAWTKNIAHVIGGLNTITTILLIWALIAIKQKKYEWHKRLMTLAFYIGALFLVCYITYHMTNPSVAYVGSARTFYLTLLVSHILLSVAVVPFVLYSLYYAWTGQYDLHIKITKYSYPVWLYVSASGVFVYYMLHFISQHKI